MNDPSEQIRIKWETYVLGSTGSLQDWTNAASHGI